jgi:hypothetical protein
MRRKFNERLKKLLFLIRFWVLLTGTLKSKAAKANEIVLLENKESNEIHLVKNNSPHSNRPSSNPGTVNGQFFSVNSPPPAAANKAPAAKKPPSAKKAPSANKGNSFPLGYKRHAKPVPENKLPGARRNSNPSGGSNPGGSGDGDSNPGGSGGGDSISKDSSPKIEKDSRVQTDTFEYQVNKKARKANKQCSLDELDENQCALDEERREQIDISREKPVVVSRIKDSKRLVKEAEKSCKNDAVQRDLNHLEDELRNGNLSPGKGSLKVGGLQNVWEARGTQGGRLYYRITPSGIIEILAKSGKSNQQDVINIMDNLNY